MKKCPACGRSDSVILWSISPLDLASKWKKSLGIDISKEYCATGEISFCSCLHCDLQYFSPIVTGGSGLYAKLQKFEWYYMADKWEHRQALSEITAGNLVCEIGCGDGVFVERANTISKGCAVGLELNPEAVAVAVGRKLPVLCVPLDEYAAKNNTKFDMVCAFQVLEHVADPATFVRFGKVLLKPGGKWILSVPNRDSFMKRCNSVLDMPPHHVTRWSARALKELLMSGGFRSVEVRYEPLACYHVGLFVDSLVMKYQGTLAGILVRHWRFRYFLTKLLQAKYPRRWIKGHTLYVSAELPAS